MIFAMKKKVFIALKMAGVAGQNKLAGDTLTIRLGTSRSFARGRSLRAS